MPKSLCTNMKDDGIEVFTIGFDLDDRDMNKDERGAGEIVLKNCSTKDALIGQHYFEASTGEELDAAFQGNHRQYRTTRDHQIVDQSQRKRPPLLTKPAAFRVSVRGAAPWP